MREIGTHWTLEMTEELRERHAKGESFSQIATAISNGTPMTREAVAGKVWREGLCASRKITLDENGNVVKTSPRPRVMPDGKERHHPFRDNPAYKERRRRRASDQKASTIGGSWTSDAKQLTAPSLPIDVVKTAPGMKGIGLEDLNDSVCHWPLWAHTRKPWDSAAVLYCGAPAEKGLPYCTHHCERAYTPCGPVNGYRIPGG